jgi:hypothetical protein
MSLACLIGGGLAFDMFAATYTHVRETSEGTIGLLILI